MRLWQVFLMAMVAVVAVGAACNVHAVAAPKQYGPGASDDAIKIGNIMPYSGPASAYGVIGQTEAALANSRPAGFGRGYLL